MQKLIIYIINFKVVLLNAQPTTTQKYGHLLTTYCQLGQKCIYLAYNLNNRIAPFFNYVRVYIIYTNKL